MNRQLLFIPILVTALLGSNPVLAGGGATHSGQASVHSAQAVGHSAVSGAKSVSGSAAVPLMIIGEIGEVSAAAGNELWDAANTPIGNPLPVTDETYMIGPSPGLAIQQ